MTKAVMHREPLERYLLSKVQSYSPGVIEDLTICPLMERRDGCNWQVQRLAPKIPFRTARDLDINVVAPIRETIDLAD